MQHLFSFVRRQIDNFDEERKSTLSNHSGIDFISILSLITVMNNDAFVHNKLKQSKIKIIKYWKNNECV
uniref:CSON007636 protein n=1 Tax=Culicoides sonorensis TaxID=179676 RepID=A0A336MYK8_CULSO